MIEHIPKKGTTIDAAIADAIALAIQHDSLVAIKMNGVSFWVDKIIDPKGVREAYEIRLLDRYYRQQE